MYVCDTEYIDADINATHVASFFLHFNGYIYYIYYVIKDWLSLAFLQHLPSEA